MFHTIVAADGFHTVIMSERFLKGRRLTWTQAEHTDICNNTPGGMSPPDHTVSLIVHTTLTQKKWLPCKHRNRIIMNISNLITPSCPFSSIYSVSACPNACWEMVTPLPRTRHGTPGHYTILFIILFLFFSPIWNIQFLMLSQSLIGPRWWQQRAGYSDMAPSWHAMLSLASSHLHVSGILWTT